MDRFKFIPWPSNVPVQGNPREENEKMLFDVFAAGRSFRDWETFFSALKETNLRCCVVATKKDIRNKGIPNEVAIYYDISHNEYLELLGKAKIVVIPLKKTFRSIGQAAILEAMAFGKAVITAELTGTMDYVQTGINGLFYEPGDTKSLRDAILRLLKDNDLQRKLGEAAKQSIENYFNKNSYSERMLETMLEVCLHG
jgi:glycosyltransferase involved in cell wall biosynthesis